MASLTEYKKKRHFNKTPEPGPEKKRTKSGRIFVIQKHRATALHYDFRLEADGVLKSWAVPKGPSLIRTSNGWRCRLRIIRLTTRTLKASFRKANTAADGDGLGLRNL